MRDVMQCADKQASLAKRHLAERQADRKARAVLPLPDQILRAQPEPLGCAALDVSSEMRLMLAPIWLGHETFHVPADELVRLIPEHLLNPLINRFDDPCLIDGDDAIGDIVHDPGKACLALLNGHGHVVERECDLVQLPDRIGHPCARAQVAGSKPPDCRDQLAKRPKDHPAAQEPHDQHEDTAREQGPEEEHLVDRLDGGERLRPRHACDDGDV